MRVLVTGATGFFGRGIAARLRGDGHAVTGAARTAGPGVTALDITDAAACRGVMAQGFDAVVHAAALAHVRPGLVSAASCRATNATGTRHVADAAAEAGVQALVFISSAMVYGDFDLPVPVTEASPRRAEGIYGIAKIEAEDHCDANAGRMAVTILRPASMYAPDWLLNVRKRVAAPGVGRYCYFTLDPGTPRYSLCSLRNGCEAVSQAVAGRIAAGIYNVADATAYRQADILRAVEAVEGRRPHVPVPLGLARAAWALARLVLGDSARRDRVHSRYWKFCETNVYSSARIVAAGVPMPADLLTVTEGAMA